jgi:hypothetical protein
LYKLFVSSVGEIRAGAVFPGTVRRAAPSR